MTIRKLLTACMLLLLPGVLSADSPLEFKQAWSPLAPPGRTMAGYVTIVNNGKAPVALIGGESPGFERIELHSMSMDDGVMRMRRLEELEIDPGKSAVLERGGLHLMLFEPQAPFQVGDEIDVELIDREGGRHALQLEVRER